MTRWKFTGAPSALQLEAIAAVFQEGGVLLLPTDTIYGLHTRATDETAVARIAALKGRDDQKPFLALGSSIDQLEALGCRFPEAAVPALEELWPGPLTAIVPLARPVAAARNSPTLGVRIPDLEWLRWLADRIGPIASTSANRSGEPPLTDPSSIPPELSAGLQGIADGGLLEGQPSVLVDFTSIEPRLIREGHPLFTQFVWKTLRKTL